MTSLGWLKTIIAEISKELAQNSENEPRNCIEPRWNMGLLPMNQVRYLTIQNINLIKFHTFKYQFKIVIRV